jgi:hypothetical protein
MHTMSTWFWYKTGYDRSGTGSMSTVGTLAKIEESFLNLILSICEKYIFYSDLFPLLLIYKI